MPILLALAGFVVFLCVFGLRGLKIAGAVFGCAGFLFVAWISLAVRADNEHAREVRVQQEAALTAADRGFLKRTTQALPMRKQDSAYDALLQRLNAEAKQD
jgi:hypothetical protein